MYIKMHYGKAIPAKIQKLEKTIGPMMREVSLET